jgi:hypothetical protein
MATSSASTIEQLIIRIGADVVELRKGMAEASKSVEGLNKTTQDTGRAMGTNLAAAFTRVTAVVAGAVAAFAAARASIDRFQSTISDITALGRLSTQTGIAVERLSELKGAAELAGVPFEVLQQSIASFTQRLSEGLSDRLSAVSLALNTLGVSARDGAGQLRGFDQLLPEIAERLSQFGDGLGKTQIAVALFGEEAGPRLLALLNQGAEGIRRLTEEARRNGVITQEQVVAAREYEVSLANPRQSTDNLARVFTVHLAPALTNVINLITAFIRILPGAGTAADQAAEAQRRYVIQLDRVLEFEERLARARATGAELAARQIERLLGPAQQELARLREEFLVRSEILRILQATSNVPPPTNQAPDQASQRLGAQEAISEAQHQLAILQERMSGQRALFDELNFQWNAHATIIEEASRRIGVAYQTQGDRRRALANIERQLNRQSQEQILRTAEMAAQTITALFPKQKGAAAAAAIINTAVGITRALSIGFPPWNWTQAALIAAQGAAQLATIRSTTETGGPTPSLGGGGAGRSPEQGEPSRMLTVSGINPSDLFTGQTLVGLIERINHEVSQGVTLISTRTR